MIVLKTERLNLRWFDIKDAPFILELVNDPAWIQFIGDKGVRNLEDAKNYIVNGPIDMYNKLGFGLYLVERKEDLTPLGMCGLIKRDSLEDVDIGFAFLETFRSKGYGYESASAIIEYGVQKLGMKRIVAITSIDNIASGKLLENVGLRFEKIISDSGEDLKLFGYNA
ncbi:ribosomal-protein-alanine acetyltransferase [Bacillus cereus BAG1X2-3]|uniref:N-acetyltransferase n=1 Tax=Bacillus cereus TaxID=1396 RepID=A0A9X7EAL7_BACCE|nr:MULTISPECIES: GNAT family N-acetyltransferase [Bacillus cereus group]EOO28239.1 ribosomal-protein-alanine acetyltransferase [Bacillus cereus BAG1X1-1]EOO47666.1 ribosomal-protein-alanine acetyltransferase [Bacillus cereus BAG1X2-1]EOO53766.1 ribosomal-protein-alanine acetyltransferase [Bacillus cereus BAG1X2-2]EOO58716.1 ribosomal-protein-alanine acetyltransferase [Bacillus cereus BAG1X2-3]EOP04712.1 ribosomal-protein-alanine acetyltransferase [Bacillus cereus BAG2O-1]